MVRCSRRRCTGSVALAREVYIPRAVTPQKNVKTHRSLNLALAGLTTLAALSAACAGGPGGGGNLRVKKIAMVAQPPGNVAAYFSVYTKEGAPVTDLDTPNFQVWENNKLVSDKKAKRALLETKPVEAQYVLVLLDVSGPYVDGEDFPDIVTAVGHLVTTVEKASGQIPALPPRLSGLLEAKEKFDVLSPDLGLVRSYIAARVPVS